MKGSLYSCLLSACLPSGSRMVNWRMETIYMLAHWTPLQQCSYNSIPFLYRYISLPPLSDQQLKPNVCSLGGFRWVRLHFPPAMTLWCVFSASVCKMQASKSYIESLPRKMKEVVFLKMKSLLYSIAAFWLYVYPPEVYRMLVNYLHVYLIPSS